MLHITIEQLNAREAKLKTLLLHSLEGRTADYHAFLEALAVHLRGFLRRRITHRQTGEIEDLIQEILLAVHKTRHTYRAEQPLTAWVQAITKYKIADHFRAFARRDNLQCQLEGDSEFFAFEESESIQAKHDISRLLQLLPDRQRLPIIHVKLKGLSVAETARLTGLSCPAVKIGIHRGLKCLAVMVRGKENDERMN